MDRRELWDLAVAVASIAVAFYSIQTYPIAAGCLLVYGALIGYRTQSDWFRQRTEEHSLEFFLLTTLLLVTALADLFEWI